VPAPNSQAVTETRNGKAVIADKADSVRFIGVEGGRVVYEVGCGQYQFHVANQSAQGKQ
jgi:hypothetical protein